MLRNPKELNKIVNNTFKILNRESKTDAIKSITCLQGENQDNLGDTSKYDLLLFGAINSDPPPLENFEKIAYDKTLYRLKIDRKSNKTQRKIFTHDTLPWFTFGIQDNFWSNFILSHLMYRFFAHNLVCRDIYPDLDVI